MTPTQRLALTALLLGSASLTSGIAGPNPELQGPSGLCYLETERVRHGVPAEQLSVAACNRALHFQRLTREGRSIVFHNRGVIQLASGETAAARVSFERAVDLAGAVDLRNLALAQVAHEQGDYPVAIDQYDALIAVAHEHPAIAENIDALKRNRDRARRAQRSASPPERLAGLTDR